MRTGGLRVCFVVMTLVLAMGSACTKGSSAPPPITSPPPPPGPPGAVAGLKAAQPHRWDPNPKTWKVTLSWRAPASGSPVDHYEVARDGRTIERNVDASPFTDDHVEPGAAYRYRVVAVTADGQSGKAANAVVKTKKPSLEDARLDGHYLTRFTVTSSNVGATGVLPIVVNFTAKCGHGACDSEYERVGRDGSGVLQRKGAAYAGTVSAQFQLRTCHGSSVDESLAIALHVTKAGVVHHEWRATAIEGSMTESLSASGCITGVNHWDIAGKSGV